MRQITLADLDRQPFSLHHVAAVDMVPRRPTFASLPGGRPASCLFYIVSGSCSFSWEGGEVRMDPGCLGYLPRGSVHLYRTLTPQIRYIRLDFQMQSPEDGEHLVLSLHPLVLLEQTPAELERTLHEIAATCQSLVPGTALAAQAQLCRILCQLYAQRFAQRLSGPCRRALPALRFLEAHPERAVSPEELAALCGLSVTHLRRLFRACTGMGPTEYHTRLRIQRACQLLREGERNISEIADALGYENAFYFSRVFKKVMGVPPRQYQDEERL